MTPLSLYIDSSVVGGYFDEEFKKGTRELWRQMEQGHFRFVASVLLQQEIDAAPARVRHLMARTFPQQKSILPITTEAQELAKHYIDQEVVPAAYADDARHVAIAVVHRITIIVSWNFKHLVNLRREAGFNSVNILLGHPNVHIVSPLELIYGDDEKI